MFESITVQKSTRAYEGEGVVEDFLGGTTPDGYLTAAVLFTDGTRVQVPHPENFPNYPVTIEPGVVIAVRGFIVPAVDNRKGSSTYGKVIDSKRYVWGEGKTQPLSKIMTRDEYLASEYDNKPTAAQLAASGAEVF